MLCIGANDWIEGGGIEADICVIGGRIACEPGMNDGPMLSYLRGDGTGKLGANDCVVKLLCGIGATKDSVIVCGAKLLCDTDFIAGGGIDVPKLVIGGGMLDWERTPDPGMNISLLIDGADTNEEATCGNEEAGGAIIDGANEEAGGGGIDIDI
jgi:hypothetical protein